MCGGVQVFFHCGIGVYDIGFLVILFNLDIFPAASWRMISVPLCCAILLCTQVLPMTGFQTDDIVAAIYN